MKKLLGIAVISLGLLVGCGGEDPQPRPTVTETITGTPTTPVTPSRRPIAPTLTPANSPTSVAPPAEQPATPTMLPENLQEYMLRLEAIKPEFSSNEQQALARGRAVCAVVAQHQADYFELVAKTKAEFTGATDEQAKQILDVITGVVCP